MDVPTVNTKTVEPKGKLTSISHEDVRLSGFRPMLIGNSSHSRSRGRPKSRSRSNRGTHIVGPSMRSVSRSNPDRKTIETRQNTTHTQGQPNHVPNTRTWANVARVMTKGYNLPFVPLVEEDGKMIVDITP